ncbi:hypothetical protein EJ04DRAFT_604549 [Polyplosphaeria fusca]|uniref:Uncharacterized protein n=1 Tax=Polyplosphaeria fusca TaxID=682080 RepID=A0A9P4V828_9PLEO|nr:hypothetical protein EJ04DRAFT_604549 [Polyplosphaeria fusca]
MAVLGLWAQAQVLRACVAGTAESQNCRGRWEATRTSGQGRKSRCEPPNSFQAHRMARGAGKVLWASDWRAASGRPWQGRRQRRRRGAGATNLGDRVVQAACRGRDGLRRESAGWRGGDDAESGDVGRTWVGGRDVELGRAEAPGTNGRGHGSKAGAGSGENRALAATRGSRQSLQTRSPRPAGCDGRSCVG